MRYAVVGVGECGNRVADALKDRLGGGALSGLFKERPAEAEFLAINTSEKDLDEIENLGRREILRLDGPPGTGANRALGQEAVDDARVQIEDRLSAFGACDAFLVVGSTAGGTGGTLMPAICRMLGSMRSSTPTVALAVLPFEHESEIYHTNTAEALPELHAADPRTILLAANDRLRRGDVTLSKAYPEMNAALTERVAMLLEALGSEMEVSADLGDLLTVASAGSGYATIGYAEGTSHQPLGEVIQRTFQPDQLLFPVDPSRTAERALILIEAPEDQLSMDDILEAVSELTRTVGDVFKGVRVTKGSSRVLSLFALGKAEEIDGLLAAERAAGSDAGQDDLSEKLSDVGDYELD